DDHQDRSPADRQGRLQRERRSEQDDREAQQSPERELDPRLHEVGEPEDVADQEPERDGDDHLSDELRGLSGDLAVEETRRDRHRDDEREAGNDCERGGFGGQEFGGYSSYASFFSHTVQRPSSCGW